MKSNAPINVAIALYLSVFTVLTSSRFGEMTAAKHAINLTTKNQIRDTFLAAGSPNSRKCKHNAGQ
jgi:hypothetical protein